MSSFRCGLFGYTSRLFLAISSVLPCLLPWMSVNTIVFGTCLVLVEYTIFHFSSVFIILCCSMDDWHDLQTSHSRDIYRSPCVTGFDI
ncbi:hypothetical protein BJX99DRAFT_136289 [Aspergillus californicus]